MKPQGLVLWHDAMLKYSFPNKIFTSDKYQAFIQQVRQRNPGVDIHQVSQKVEWAVLEDTISKAHLKVLTEMSETGKGFLDPITPAFKDMLTPARFMIQATYDAYLAVLRGDYPFAINVAGGLHHATPNQSMGGCILNDVALAIAKLRKNGFKEKIAILDLDYHPHNGTVEHLMGDPTTFKASIHEAGWFDFDDGFTGIEPGFGNVLSIGLKKPIDCNEYLAILEKKIFPPMSSFQPDLLVVLNGVDPHIEDSVVKNYPPPRKLAFSDEDFRKIIGTLIKFSWDMNKGKMVVLGAGGYDLQSTTKIWYQTLCQLTEHFKNF